MQNTPPQRGFPESEYQDRLKKAQQRMRDAGMDILLLNSEPEVRYFSGFLTQFWLSPTRPWFLLVPASGKPVAVIPSIGEALMNSTWIDDIRCWSSPQPQDEGVSLLVGSIIELVGKRATIGLCQGEESSLRMPLQDLYGLQNQLGDCKWMNCTPIVRALRQVKSAAEVEKLRYICTTVSNAFELASELFFQGQALDAAFRAFKIALLEHGVDDVPYLVGAAGQGGYGDIISPPSNRPLKAGDVMMLDTGATFDGYFADFDRNFALGKASKAAQNAYAVLYDATEAGLESAKPGATCDEVYHAMQGVISQTSSGSGGVGRMGHGLGMQLTEWPSHRAGDHTPIETGMVLTLEPSMAISADKVMVHEENILITDNGPELLSRRAAPELPVI